MNTFANAWDTLTFIIPHMFRYEVQLMLFLAAVASWQLSMVLAKHNGRMREEQLARRIAYGLVMTMVIIFTLGKLWS